MTSATERLMDLVAADDCFDIAPTDLLPEQLQAANERLRSQIGEIGLLANRAESSDVKQIKEPADLVPLLFAHTTYKTYAEGWLGERRWDRMGKWLATVSTRFCSSALGCCGGGTMPCTGTCETGSTLT